MVFFYGRPLPLLLWFTLIADWAGCPDTPSLPLVLLCFLETILYLGPPNGRIVFPALVLQRYCRSLRCANFCMNFTTRYPATLLYIVTMSVMCISPPTRCNTNAPSMLRLMFISSAKRLPLVMLMFFIFQQHHSLLISSPKGSQPRSLKIPDTVSLSTLPKF